MKRKSWKRTAAFVTSLAMTTTMLPSDLSGIVTSIVHATATSYENVEIGARFTAGDTITFNQDFANEYYINGTKIDGTVYEISYDCVVYDRTHDGNTFRFTLGMVPSGMAAGSELPELSSLITAEEAETWTVIALPGTVKTTTGTNAESSTYTGVKKITSAGIFNDGTDPVAAFRDTDKDDTNANPGLGIYVDSIDVENKTLTLTWKDPVQNDCLINFADNDVWTAVKSIVYGGENYYLKGLQGEYRKITAKTGEEVTVHSAKALNFNTTADVRFNETKVRNSETGDLVEYVYTITVGRHDIVVKLRDTNVSYANAPYVDNDSTPEDLQIFKDTETTRFGASELDADSGNYIFRAGINPDAKYRIESSEDNLSVFEESDGEEGFTSGDRKIDYKKSEMISLVGDTIYSYEFTAPYENVYISRSAPHTHEFTWGKSTNEKELVATCSKNGEENEHVTDFTYNYGLKLTDFTGENVEIGNAASYKVEFVPLTNNGTALVKDTADYNAALALLNTEYAQRVVKYSKRTATGWSEPSSLAADKPSTVGSYKVIVDVYKTAEAYNEDEKGNFRFVKEFKIVPAASSLSVTATGYTLVDKNGSASADSGKDYYLAVYDADGEWAAPEVTVTNGATVLTKGEDYVLEGDVTSATKGTKELAVIGIGAYEGYTGELKWYAPSDLNRYPINVNGAAVVGGGYEYGTSLDFSVSGFDGNQDKITYKAVPYQDTVVYTAWSRLTSDQQQVVRGYFDGDFVEPVEPQPIDINEDTVLNVLAENELYTKAKAIEDAEDRAVALEALGLTDAPNRGYVVLAYYDNSENPLTGANILINAKGVALSLDDNRFTYDGENHIGDYELTTNDLITKDASLLNALKNVEIKYVDTNWVTGETELKNVKAGGYTLGYSKSDVEAVLGNNYTITNASVNPNNVPNVTAPATKPTCFALSAFIDPLNLDGTATATADKTIFVENGKFQKPVITVTAGDDTLVYNTDYSLSGAISAKTAGERVTRIVGKGNYTGSLKVSWKVLGAEDFRNAIDVAWNENSPVAMKVTSNGTNVDVVKFSFNRKATTNADGYEVTDYGYIYSNAAGCDTLDLTIENSEADARIVQVSSGKTTFNGNYALKVIERGNGVAARGYVTLKHTATGGTYTVYTGKVATTYATLTEGQLDAAITLNYGSATTADKATALVVNNQNAIKVKFKRTLDAEAEAAGITVKDYGFVYTNSALAPQGATETNEAYAARAAKYNALNIEDVDNTVICQARPDSVTKNNGIYNVTIRDKGDEIRYRAYVVLQNSEGATYTKYLDIQTAAFDTLSEDQVNRLVTVETKRLAGTYDGDGYFAAKFQTVRSLGEGVKTSDVTVLDYGFIYSNTINEETANFTVEAAEENVSNNPVKKVKTTTPVATLESGKPGKYGVVIKFDGDEDHSHMIYTRGYVKVKDNNTGVVRTVYGGIIETTCVIRDLAYPTT